MLWRRYSKKSQQRGPRWPSHEDSPLYRARAFLRAQIAVAALRAPCPAGAARPLLCSPPRGARWRNARVACQRLHGRAACLCAEALPAQAGSGPARSPGVRGLLARLRQALIPKLACASRFRDAKVCLHERSSQTCRPATAAPPEAPAQAGSPDARPNQPAACLPDRQGRAGSGSSRRGSFEQTKLPGCF